MIASATSRSSWACPIRPATAATWESTHAAASRVRAGAEWMVASATVRARHAGTRPLWTCGQSRGRRWRSSRACPMSFFAASVEMPRTVPSSATQNSATSGQPGPAMGSSCSRPSRPPPIMKDAAESIDSGGCRSAHLAAAVSRSAAALSSVAFRSRTNASRAAGLRSSSTSAPICGPAARVLMCSIVGRRVRQSSVAKWSRSLQDRSVGLGGFETVARATSLRDGADAPPQDGASTSDGRVSRQSPERLPQPARWVAGGDFLSQRSWAGGG